MKISSFFSIIMIALICFLLHSKMSCCFADDEKTISSELWMNTWMSTNKISGGILHLVRFKDPVYILTKPITWKPDNENSKLKPVTVPKGFVTDLASIPPIFFSILRPDGIYTHPAIVHDYQYWTQDVSRKEADEIFRLGMKEFETGTIKTIGIYNAVRIGGAKAWESNAKQKAAGEKRILKRFPEDPKITWKEWKENPEVFK